MTSQHSPNPAVIAISSHVSRGSVGNRAIVFALEVLGYPVWSVPTVTMPWHPGHGPSTRLIPETGPFNTYLAELSASPWLKEVGGVISGYLGDALQAAAIAKLVTAVKAENPNAIYVCDPVIGDDGGLYVPVETAVAIRDQLLPLADIATPNRFELEWLAGDADGNIVDLANRLDASRVLVTSAFSGPQSGNLLVLSDAILEVRHDALARPPHGLGDLSAALLLANLLSGRNDEKALQYMTCSVFTLLRRSVSRGTDELALAEDADCIVNPRLELAVSRKQG